MSDYHYIECGLRNVWLENGFSIRQTKYGEGVSIHDVDGLHRAIAQSLANRPALTGAEIRFLRKGMGLSQRGLGELLGVSDQAVALWERKGRLPKTADRLLRLICAEHDQGNARVVDFIRHLNSIDQRDYERIVAEETAAGWKARMVA